MGLLIDGQINSTQDLRNYENGILDVASLENLDLMGKMALAQDEIGIEIFKFLLRRALPDPQSSMSSIPGELDRRSMGISDVVVTPELRRWHALSTLALTYADAYNNQLNDRYAGKQKQYEALADKAEDTCLEVGIGLSLNPIVRASAPVLGYVAGTGAASTFYVQVSWLNVSGQEGLASAAVSTQTANATQLTVDALNPPSNAAGWNVYAGMSPQSATLQNSGPIALGTQWMLPASGLISGQPAGSGQTADQYVVNQRALLRG